MFSLLSSELKIQQVCWLHPREIKFSSSFTSSKAKQTSFTCWSQAKRFLFFFYWVQLFSRRLNNLVWAGAGVNWTAFLLSWLLGTYLERLNWKQYAIWTKKFPIQFCKWKHNQRESLLFLFLIQKRLFIEKRDVLVVFLGLFGASFFKKWLPSYLFPISNLFNFSKKEKHPFW